MRFPRRGTPPIRLLGGLALLLAPHALLAQEDVAAGEDAATKTAERCRGPEYRQFDFWIGSWEVHNPDGELVGHNTISSVARGCGLLEEWRGRQGGRGVSVNAYESASGRWTQRWVGDGTNLQLVGGGQDGNMVLEGTSPRETPRGTVRDRITWSPLPDGRVRQTWEISSDEGETWRVAFVGLYSRVATEEGR